MSPFHTNRAAAPMLNRRTLLGGAAAAAAIATVGCTTEKPQEDTAQNRAVLPSYIPYDGVEPDYPAESGRSSAAFTTYPADPPVFSDQTPGDGTPVTFMGPTSFAPPPTLPNNKFWQEMNERVGSPLDIVVTPAGEYNAKFATATAGDLLPDMFYIGAATSLPQFMSATAADLTDFLAGDAITDYPGLANIPEASWRQCVFGGRIRALPLERGLVSLGSILCREDLMEAAGMSVADATDLAALEEMSKELTGGGQFAWTGSPLGHIKSMYDIPQTFIRDEGGRLTQALLDERQEEALEAARRMTADGVVHPEAAATQVANRKAWFGTGIGVLHPDSFIAWFSLYVQYGNQTEGLEIQALPVNGVNGGKGTQSLPNPNFGITAINANVGDRLPTLLKIADWLAAPVGTEEYRFNKYGIEGHNFTLENGSSDPVPTDKADEVNIGSLYMCDAARAIYSPGRPDAVESAWNHQRSVTEKCLDNPVFGYYSASAEKNLSALNRDLKGVSEDIVLGRRPVSDWRPAAQRWIDEGGQTIIDEYQKDIDTNPME
ncbi:type 2 periplasmic-binding domain-containing protein [Parenemella sanctibonifatiensis]|uniref:Extracellular solute-binding protein n=1 Tax=Parenemella sanctibonifatiensis TaxID=2016505 RepID=A0A255ENX4_9ACTN|nr:hypothetical protein [Parenemella sanctibonifatiensis]OYN92671.1 hypothetical protein CGZ91_04160 [Parenemella sanctibonifatiensis]